MTARQIPAVIAAAVDDLPRAARQRLHDEIRIVDVARAVGVPYTARPATRQQLGPPLAPFALARATSAVRPSPGR